MRKAAAELIALRARLEEAESNLLACFRALGMDANGADTNEIPEAIIRLKTQLAHYEVAEEVDAALKAVTK